MLLDCTSASSGQGGSLDASACAPHLVQYACGMRAAQVPACCRPPADHDIFDGFGSYEADMQGCPVLQVGGPPCRAAPALLSCSMRDCRGCCRHDSTLAPGLLLTSCPTRLPCNHAGPVWRGAALLPAVPAGAAVAAPATCCLCLAGPAQAAQSKGECHWPPLAPTGDALAHNIIAHSSSPSVCRSTPRTPSTRSARSFWVPTTARELLGLRLCGPSSGHSTLCPSPVPV